MRRILHISDLHLVAGSPEAREDEVGDYTKSRLVGPEERQTRLHLLKDSLAALERALAPGGQQLDAVVVTGDVALRGDAASYQLLPEVLGSLGDLLPPAGQIMVVPGNHDVLYGSLPSSSDRYADFGDAIDALGYRRPGLEGRDDLTSHDPLLIGPAGAFVVVGINSANWSVSVEPLSVQAQAQLDTLESQGLVPKELHEAIASLRLHDAARVSLEQMKSVGHALDQLPKTPDRRRVVFAAIHHQLFPVSAAEEVKTFETMTNLADLRRFLADNQVDVVLHGHKHVARTYENDWIESSSPNEQPERHRLIVSSAGTVGHGVGQGAEIAKLIEIDDDIPMVPKIVITPIAAVGPAAQLKTLDGQRSSYRLTENYSSQTTTVFQGPTAEAVHSQLLAHFVDQSDAPSLNLTCVIADGRSALRRPASYPSLADHPLADDPDAFFDDLVDWWQNARTAEGKPFTHGQRIHAWSDEPGNDQLVNVANALLRDQASSRGLVALFDPGRDDIDNIAVKFPAFVMAQFHIQDSALHVLGVFRKQEMRYWWPINVAELATMQARVIDLLSRHGKTIYAGSVTTFSTQAKAGRTIPRVAVPRIDQLVWEMPSRVWALAATLCVPVETPQLEAAVDDLCALMNEWKPADREAPDGAPVAGPGLLLLSEALRSLGVAFQTRARTQRLVELLALLHASNERYGTDDPRRALTYSDWRDQTRANIDEFCSVLRSLPA